MKRLLLALSVILFLYPGSLLAAEKVKYGTSIKTYPVFYLPVLAAEEKGFWKQNGLDAEWVPFASGAAHFTAIAGGAIHVGSMIAIDQVQLASRGIAVVATAGIRTALSDFMLWVRPDSPIKVPGDLKGAKVGVSRPGGAEHAYARLALKALGAEKDVRFIGTGGIPESIASLKAGNIDGVVLTVFQMIERKLKGEVREVFGVDDHLPKEWLAVVSYASKDFAFRNPELLKRVVKSIIQGADYTHKDPTWTKGKMKELNGYSDAAADFMYPRLNLSRDGKIVEKALENVRNFSIEYGIVAPEKTPPVNQLYTNEYLG